MPLRKRLKPSAGEGAADAGKGGGDGKKSKRQRLVDFFRYRKHKGGGEDQAATVQSPSLSPTPLASSRMLMAFRSKIPVPTQKTPTSKPAQASVVAETVEPAQAGSSIDAVRTSPEQEEHEEQVAPAAPDAQVTEEAQIRPLTEEQIHSLFSGAPHFGIDKSKAYPVPRASFPWDDALAVRDVSDALQLAHPAFSAATLRRHLPALDQSSDQDKQYLAYDAGVVEVPSMLSSQGREPGSIGFVNFLELPIADTLVTELQQSQSSNGFLESVRNKELMQKNPERLGIRRVDMAILYDRLAEFGDLLEVFQDSPERMTILNNQSSGDLYANLFGKFLVPPGYDDSADDPTGMKVQIDTLLKILRLKGFWYDFSLVEWRIRLGQILWSDPDSDSLVDTHPRQSWSAREILLLQITLACELFLRLDAVTSMDADDVKREMHVSPEDFDGFLKLKSTKTDWDMVLARRFLDNILIMKGGSAGASVQTTKPRGLLSMLSSKEEPKSSPEPDVVFLPRHQARQLSGLVCFAETIRWPDMHIVINELARKLGVSDSPEEPEQPPSHRKFLEPSISSAVSIYGTPLATPRSTGSVRDSYFGHISKPALERSDSQSLKVPLSPALTSFAADPTANTFSIGGWLSRSYLTGLILPGEAISHLLMSTLLENDKLAIAALGDAANLYGGFVYAEQSWWSKNCIVGRIIACMEGAVECMGWISVAKVPDALSDGWYAVSCESLPREQPPRIEAEEDLVFRDSVFIPGDVNNVKSEELVLPLDPSTPPVPSIGLAEWNLMPMSPQLREGDESSSLPPETEVHIASFTFASFSRGTSHTFRLNYDVQFVTSFPCTPPSSSIGANTPEVLKSQLSRSSSKRSMHSTKSGSKRLSRFSSRRNSHGFEPLLSHPPDSPSIAPTRVYSPVPDEQVEEKDAIDVPKSVPMMAHPLHASYKYKMVPVTDVLDPHFMLPFKASGYASPAVSTPSSVGPEDDVEKKTILVLDARAARDLELLARSWCSAKGLHAIIGRAGRTCLACCVREARGLGLNVVIRV